MVEDSKTSAALVSQDLQFERIYKVCDELQRTLRGGDDSAGLVTEIALLNQQTSRLSAALDAHIQEHRDDRDKQKLMKLNVFERLISWALIVLLSMAVLGGRRMLYTVPDLAPATDAQQSDTER